MSFQETLSKNKKILHKKCILKRYFYNFECLELILKVSFENTFSIILKFLNLSLNVFQIFKKYLLKIYFLNYITDMKKTILYLGLLFKLHSFKIFFFFFFFFRKVPN